MNIIKYLQATLIDLELQFNPSGINLVKYAAPIHCHDFYEFFLIIKGRCIHKVNYKDQYLMEGALIFIRPDDIHYYVNYGDIECEFINNPCCCEVVEDAFTFLGDSCKAKVLLEQPMPPVIHLSQMETDNFINHYEKIRMLCMVDKQQARIQFRSMLVEILAKHFMGNSDTSKKDTPLWLESLLIQMQKKDNFTI